MLDLKLIVLLTLLISCFGMNYQFSRELYDTVLSNYSRHLKPRDLSADVVEVEINFSINTVINYDEKSGVFTFLGKFTLKWWDQKIMWDTSHHGNLDMVQLSIHDVWVPKIAIGNSINYHSLYKFDNYFDSKMIYVTYLENGSASITSSRVWETTCNSDVSKFPFDVHECKIQLKAEEPITDVKLKTKQIGADISYTSMHSEFKIRDTSVKHMVVQDGVQWSNLIYALKLGREPLFMMMNLVIPIYIISASNLLVFLLPIDSSDRVAFSVTMLLTFTVFMTMATEELPATDTLSNFNIFLMLQLVFSTFITVCVLLIHYLYRKDEEKDIPEWINSISNYGHRGNNHVDPIKKGYMPEEGTKWGRCARTVNKCVLITFTIIIISEFVVLCSLSA